ncbi:MAG: ATP-binding cassette domain-containing protein, partial [Planctomycetota bacterium]
MTEVWIHQLTKVFLDGTRAVDLLDLRIRHGELLVLVGPSGCGKTTTLRMLAGLESPSSGEISFDGQSVRGLAPRQRDVAMVFQNYALYPHMTVAANLSFPLRMRGATGSVAKKRAHDLAEKLGISRLLSKKP